jgi:hypothetical protein
VVIGAKGIHRIFVAADNDGVHVFEFYRVLGGVPAPVTAFSFPA